MKRLKDEISLVGRLEEITLMDLRKSTGEIFQAVSLGKTFVITKAGKPVAVISKPPGESLVTNIDSKGDRTYSL
ncbi:MAG TPA: type II toxin-antitoxin system prevent-host-death family antitoxin [bacterium]|nr:type II toxin-antitoxin system prevent-host-death family antitoxin [bacterium]